MQGFEEIIIQLLLRHNCVVVPGFGGFVAKQISSEIDLDRGLISPPKKALLFNRFLLADDGLFLAEFARVHGLFYEEAKNKLQAHTDFLQRQLSKGEVIRLPKLGTFTKESDGQIKFEQDRFFNLLMSSYGLAKLNFVAQQQEQTQEQTKEVPILELQPKIAPQKTNWGRIAAAACILPFAFYSFWIPTQTNALESGLFSSSDFNPLHRKTPAAYTKAHLKSSQTNLQEAPKLHFEQALHSRYETYEWQPGYDFIVNVPAQEIIPNAATPVQTSNAAFDYIVGCFSNFQNAKNLQLKLIRDGFAARLIENGALTKVSAGAAQNISELQNIKQQAAERGLQGWVLNN